MKDNAIVHARFFPMFSGDSIVNVFVLEINPTDGTLFALYFDHQMQDWQYGYFNIVEIDGAGKGWQWAYERESEISGFKPMTVARMKELYPNGEHKR